MQQYTHMCNSQPIPDDIPFEEYFGYLSRLAVLPFKTYPVNKLTPEEFYLLKNHEARLIATMYLEEKPRHEWTPRDLKILDAIRTGLNIVTIHDGIYELIEF